MFRRLTTAVLISIIVGAFAFSACGGSDDDDEDGGEEPAATEQASTEEADATETPDSSDGDGNDDDDDGSGDGDGGSGGENGDLDELRDSFEAFATARFRATYEISGGGLEGAQTLTMYRDGADRLRFDISGTMNGESFEGVVLSSAEGSLLCSTGEDFAGLPGVDPDAEGVCFQTGAGGANPFANIESFLEDIDPDEVDVISTEEREIAGEQAKCFTLNQAGEESTACLNEDGVLLLASGGAGGQSFTMTATQVSGDVSDIDFDPPYPVVELPSGF